ncbi:unnamed protein product [Dibothriocephalus latus]|uniref:Uncharacterized protein n=1 Tax=Dibothriocephalus latus TaxID=60516 RepID=A0A3P7L6R6_DIBLA|nr:unnamed protein product [Dibothriocephalus latus]
MSSLACYVNNAFDSGYFPNNVITRTVIEHIGDVNNNGFICATQAVLPKLSEAAYIWKPFLINISYLDFLFNHPDAFVSDISQWCLTKVPPCKPFVPLADVFAAAALDMLGVEEIGCGYFYHAVLRVITAPSPARRTELCDHTAVLTVTTEFCCLRHNMGWFAVIFGLAVVSPLILITYVLLSVFFKYTFGKWLYSKRKELRSAGEWAVVTGAAGGIGLAFCKELAKEGLKIFMVDGKGPKLKSAAKEVEEAFGVETRILELDPPHSVGFGVRLQTYLPCLISTEFSRVPPSNPFVPSADIFAAAALDMLGVEKTSCGYFYHALQYAFPDLPQMLCRFSGGASDIQMPQYYSTAMELL